MELRKYEGQMNTTTDEKVGFRLVTQEEFYKTVGQMNVTPYPSNRWSDEIGYLSHWKTPSGLIVGMSDDYAGGKPVGCGLGGRYWVAE
jgi:hypothetical protein